MAISPRLAIRTFSNTAAQYCVLTWVGGARPWIAESYGCLPRADFGRVRPVRLGMCSGVGLGPVIASLLFAAGASAAPPAPTITEPAADGQLVHPEDVHMVVSAPARAADDACTDWEILSADGSQVRWQAQCVTGARAVHIHLADGDFTGKELAFGSAFQL